MWMFLSDLWMFEGLERAEAREGAAEWVRAALSERTEDGYLRL